jgi:hypothetical protein
LQFSLQATSPETFGYTLAWEVLHHKLQLRKLKMEDISTRTRSVHFTDDKAMMNEGGWNFFRLPKILQVPLNTMPMPYTRCVRHEIQNSRVSTKKNNSSSKSAETDDILFSPVSSSRRPELLLFIC